MRWIEMHPALELAKDGTAAWEVGVCVHMRAGVSGDS